MNTIRSYEHHTVIWTPHGHMNTIRSYEHHTVIWTPYGHMNTVNYSLLKIKRKHFFNIFSKFWSECFRNSITSWSNVVLHAEWYIYSIFYNIRYNSVLPAMKGLTSPFFITTEQEQEAHIVSSRGLICVNMGLFLLVSIVSSKINSGLTQLD